MTILRHVLSDDLHKISSPFFIYLVKKIEKNYYLFVEHQIGKSHKVIAINFNTKYVINVLFFQKYIVYIYI